MSIMCINRDGVLREGESFVKTYKGFNIHIRRHGRRGDRKRYGTPGPNGFVALRKPLQEDDCNKKPISIAAVLFAELIAQNKFRKWDPTDPTTLEVTHTARSRELAYEGFSLCICFPQHILDEIHRKGAEINNFKGNFVKNRMYFDNMHSHNYHIIESLHELLREARRVIDGVLQFIGEQTPIPTTGSVTALRSAL